MKEKVIGQRMQRPDAVGKATGHTRFPGDLEMDRALCMKVLFSDRVHARILAIDTTEAEQVPGLGAAAIKAVSRFQETMEGLRERAERGDVLAGTIVALKAQGLSPFDAAVAGSYLHGVAGVQAGVDQGEAGTVASDLIDRLPSAWRETRR